MEVVLMRCSKCGDFYTNRFKHECSESDSLHFWSGVEDGILKASHKVVGIDDLHEFVKETKEEIRKSIENYRVVVESENE